MRDSVAPAQEFRPEAGWRLIRSNLLLVISVRAAGLPVPLVLLLPLGWLRDTLVGARMAGWLLGRLGLRRPVARLGSRLLPGAARRALALAARRLGDLGGPGGPLALEPAAMVAGGVRILDALAAAGPATLVEVRQGPTRVAVRLV